MSAPYHLIEEKLEDAIKAAILAEYGGTADAAGLVTGGDLAGFTLLTGFCLDEINPPIIAIVADQSEPTEGTLYLATGNQTVTVRLMVVGHFGESTRAGHSAAAARLKDFAYASNIVALLNASAIADLTVTWAFPAGTVRDTDAGTLRTTTTLTIKARPS